MWLKSMKRYARNCREEHSDFLGILGAALGGVWGPDSDLRESGDRERQL